jgi:NAD(P) transhydrogenase
LRPARADEQAWRVSEHDYDLIVIGSGPGGQKAAIAAAKLGKRVAVIDRQDMVGGVCVNTGTIPSKTLREAVLYLTGLNQRDLYGASYRVKQDITIADLLARTQHVVGREVQVVRAQLLRNHVDLLPGTRRFLDAHTVAVEGGNRADRHTLSGEKIVIATAPGPRGRTRSTSTRPGCWTPTRSCTWRRSRPRWSSSARG